MYETITTISLEYSYEYIASTSVSGGWGTCASDGTYSWYSSLSSYEPSVHFVRTEGTVPSRYLYSHILYIINFSINSLNILLSIWLTLEKLLIFCQKLLIRIGIEYVFQLA